jgi:arsenite methyltransferase
MAASRLVLLLHVLIPCFGWISSTTLPKPRMTSAIPATKAAVEIVDATSTRQAVSEYYGSTLKSSSDLQTNACCTGSSPPKHIQELLKNVADETKAKYYGCGLCLPDYDLTGARLLDLGCGAGRDVYLASQLVGPKGSVVGVDMTKEQLQAAMDVQTYHAEKFGFQNTEFYLGYLENLKDIPQLQDNSFDVIISNCVINLCTDKAAVLKACYDLLKPGGELYFSDVYTNRRVPIALQKDALLWGECLSGALYWNDFENLAKRAGFLDPRLVEDSPITIENKSVAAAIQQQGHGGLEFYSATYRLFKLPDLEPACEGEPSSWLDFAWCPG